MRRDIEDPSGNGCGYARHIVPIKPFVAVSEKGTTVEDQDGPVTVDVHIVATIGGINHDLGTIDVTEDDSAPQVARALRAIAAALDTPDPPRSLPDEPPATREER